MSLSHMDVTDLPATVDHSECRRVAPVLARVGDKWSILIVMTLAGGTRRFNELKREIDGISQRMLTHSLRALERDGLVSRTAYPSIPPRVDYALTELGRALCVPVMALGTWVQANLDTIERARDAFDRAEEARAAEDPRWPGPSHRSAVPLP